MCACMRVYVLVCVSLYVFGVFVCCEGESVCERVRACVRVCGGGGGEGGVVYIVFRLICCLTDFSFCINYSSPLKL